MLKFLIRGFPRCLLQVLTVTWSVCFLNKDENLGHQGPHRIPGRHRLCRGLGFTVYFTVTMTARKTTSTMRLQVYLSYVHER